MKIEYELITHISRVLTDLVVVSLDLIALLRVGVLAQYQVKL